MHSLETAKKDFINNEVLTLTIEGALERSHTYKKNTNEKQKAVFHRFTRQKLGALSRKYKSKVAEAEHVANIIELKKAITNRFDDLLKGQFRLGLAQKLLNLYLKYLWVLGWIPEPPHCPFDALVISRLRQKAKWTVLDSVDDYKQLVGAARKAAGKEKISIAEWELRLWQNRSQL